MRYTAAEHDALARDFNRDGLALVERAAGPDTVLSLRAGESACAFTC